MYLYSGKKGYKFMSVEITKLTSKIVEQQNYKNQEIQENDDVNFDLGYRLSGASESDNANFDSITYGFIQNDEAVMTDIPENTANAKFSGKFAIEMNNLLDEMEQCRNAKPLQENYANPADFGRAMDEWESRMRSLETKEQNLYIGINQPAKEENLPEKPNVTRDKIQEQITKPDIPISNIPNSTQSINPSVIPDKIPQTSADLTVKPSDIIKNIDMREMVSMEDIPKISRSIEENAAIAGVEKGTPMNFKDANGKRVNPKYWTNKYEYTHNCQSCVVAYEARRRGYNVEVVGRNKEDKTAQLAKHTSWAYVEPDTGKVCEPKRLSYNTPSELYEQINDIVKPNERYSLRYDWEVQTWYKGKVKGGHIVSLERNQDGELQLYDPQSGRKYVGKRAITNKCKSISNVDILRVDDKSFNAYFTDNILKQPKKKN